MKTTPNLHFIGSSEIQTDSVKHTSNTDGSAISTSQKVTDTLLAKTILSGCALCSLLAFCLALYFLISHLPVKVTDFGDRVDVTAEDRILKQNNHMALGELISAIKVDTTEELLERLRSKNLWDIDDNALIPPVLFANLPQDMDSLDVVTKKKAFINTLLPISLVALNEIAQEKKSLEAALQKLNRHEDTLFFGEDAIWPHNVSEKEKNFLQHLTLKYRTNSKEKLLKRVNVLPVSLILAQGALESSWGSSRFAMEGNNLFGIWTWGDEGLDPLDRDEGALHKVASYDNLLDSVRAYLLMINRLPAYSSLRELRDHSASSLDLAEGLLFYSERRNSYIDDVRQIIASNELQRFDSMTLAKNTSSQSRKKPANLVSYPLQRNANT